jgi:hypothetical protein
LIKLIKENKNKFIKYAWKKIHYNTIINNKDYVYFKKNNNLVFYNLTNKYSFEIPFKLQIDYIKYIDNNIYVIKTDKWSFVFNLANKTINFVSIFNDFILYKNNYIGVINQDDQIRKNNLWFWDENFNLLIKYNISSKEKTIIEKFDDEIEKIYLENNKVFVKTINNEIYNISWL